MLTKQKGSTFDKVANKAEDFNTLKISYFISVEIVPFDNLTLILLVNTIHTIKKQLNRLYFEPLGYGGWS
jgi:hypothetical protein